MRRPLTSAGAKALVGTLTLFGCLGTDCQQLVPETRFLELQPFELNQSGFCQDWGPGLLFHPGEDCNRRENCVLDCPQICQANGNGSNDSRDTVSPVLGTGPNGYCVYDFPWDPMTGVRGHPAWWAHAILDVVFPTLLGGL
jgi:hypothetical protein